MDKWKSFFQSSGSDIWTVIDRAITIAAVEHPSELRARRDKFTEKMFCPTTHLTGLCECEEQEEEEEENENGGRATGGAAAGSAGSDEEHEDETKVASGAAKQQHHEQEDEEQEEDEDEDHEDDHNGGGEDLEDEEVKGKAGSCSYLDVEALSDEMEEESRRIREINRLKNRISDPDEDEEYLVEALERLESMQISFETLKATSIGRPVNNLRKHPSSRVRSIVKRLVKNWKALTDEWTKSAEHMSSRPGPYDPNEDDYGLPSPPVDEGELLAAGSGPLEVKKLFDFIEDDMSAGSGDMNDQPRRGSSGDWVNGIYEDVEMHTNNNTSSKTSRKPIDSSEVENNKLSSKSRKDTIKSSDSRATAKNSDSSRDKISSVSRSNGRDYKDDISSRHKMTVSSSSSRPKPASASTSATGSRPKLPTANGLQRRPDDRTQSGKVGLTKTYHEGGITTERLAAAKRKLHEGYQQAENAKKQRTVQVMELTDLPKGKGGPKAAKAGPAKSHAQHNNRYMNHIRR